MKNEELIKNYTADIEMMAHDDYLQKEYYDKSREYKKNTLNNLALQKDYLKKYKKVFITYFKKDDMNQYKRKNGAFILSESCATVGIIMTLIYVFSAQNIYLSILNIF